MATSLFSRRPTGFWCQCPVWPNFTKIGLKMKTVYIRPSGFKCVFLWVNLLDCLSFQYGHQRVLKETSWILMPECPVWPNFTKIGLKMKTVYIRPSGFKCVFLWPEGLRCCLLWWCSWAKGSVLCCQSWTSGSFQHMYTSVNHTHKHAYLTHLAWVWHT